MRREGGLWVVDVVESDEGGAVACAVDVMHSIRGHPHNPKCEHCLRGRTRACQRPQKTLIHIDQRGETVYMDLMGPFEADLSNVVCELTVVEERYGWKGVTGLKDESAPITADGPSRIVIDVMNNSNQNPRDVGRFHSGQGREFAVEVEQLITRSGATHTNTGGYNSSSNPAESAQGRLQQTARAMLAQCTGGHSYYIELRKLLSRGLHTVPIGARDRIGALHTRRLVESHMGGVQMVGYR